MGQITLKNVSKSFGATTIIPDIDLKIEDGEFVVFVGPSGCGKSTLLRLIAGLEDTSGGTISIDGRDVTGEAPAERKLAMVFQSYALYPHMTVAKNIAFPLKMAAGPGDDRQEGRRRGAGARRSPIIWSGGRGSFPAASASASPSAAPSCGSLPPSCSTSRCRISMPRCAARCGWRSASWTTG